MAPSSFHLENHTIHHHLGGQRHMNLADIDVSDHVNTMQLIVNQYFVAFDAGMQILGEFRDMMAHQSALIAQEADEHERYWELVWANLGCGLTMITGFCTAINPIDFTLWTSLVLLLGIIIGVFLSYLCRFFTSSTDKSDLRRLIHQYGQEFLQSCQENAAKRREKEA